MKMIRFLTCFQEKDSKALCFKSVHCLFPMVSFLVSSNRFSFLTAYFSRFLVFDFFFLFATVSVKCIKINPQPMSGQCFHFIHPENTIRKPNVLLGGIKWKQWPETN